MALLSAGKTGVDTASNISLSPDTFLILILIVLSFGFVILFAFLIDLINEKKKYYKSLREGTQPEKEREG